MLACAADAYGGQHSVDLCREICVRLMGACCSRFVLGRQGPGRRKIGTVRRKEKAAALLPRRAGLKGGDEGISVRMRCGALAAVVALAGCGGGVEYRPEIGRAHV